ncbi:MarR family winged helix-turn-helix transcriptional regulator [Paracoccus shandongensis]|uniref:MarR family winged helix-turn-helix transcriptional regulator n=1 Tax=Paracoccus shandongensis TaxID=2816048 RepID=UPI001F17AB7F|nr:MarR family winged helix-turn-helix transcriptional regulator [Paracoccus shandongensis]
MDDRQAAGECPDAGQMLDRIMDSDLRYLMAVSHVVLANNQITDRFIERRHAMPVQAWSSLYAIACFPGLRARDIQVLFPRPQNTISRAVALLVGRGHVREEALPGDARAKRLFPTPSGLALLEEILPAVTARQEEMFAPLSGAERETFLALCRKLAAGPMLGRSRVMG